MSPDRSILDARLAEIDRRLRTIQTGLAPVAAPPPAAGASPHSPPSEPSPPSPPPPSSPSSPSSPPEPGAPTPAGPPDLEQVLRAAGRLTEELRELRDEQAQIIAAASSLLSQLAEQLGRDSPARAAGPAKVPAAVPAGAATHVPLAAGPFRDAAALRRLAEAIRDLPQVTGVEVREFVGRDHAVLDVTVTAPPD